MMERQIERKKGFRRIITTNDSSLGSKVLIDGAARVVGTLHEFWKAGASHGESKDDTIDGPVLIAPSSGGSVFRFVEIEPETKFHGISLTERRQQIRRSFAAVGSEDALVPGSGHPAMHKTASLDYIIVLRGRLTMILENEQVQLGPLDVVVQQGTNHAWVNEGDEPALLAAVLIASDNSNRSDIT